MITDERYDYALSIIGRRMSLLSKKIISLPVDKRSDLESEMYIIGTLSNDLHSYTPEQIESAIQEQSAFLKKIERNIK